MRRTVPPRGSPIGGPTRSLVGREVVCSDGAPLVAEVDGWAHHLLPGCRLMVVSTPRGEMRLRQVDPCACGARHEIPLAHRAGQLPAGFALRGA